ncbi:MAG: hypothetical protein PWP65_1656 [Clostridia bacterium]|nr:hypothetical protein [Clostridia bacterium]
MTTVLHRRGDVEFLQKDYIIKNKSTKGLDDVDEETKRQTVEKTREIIKIIAKNGPVNIGQGRLGSTGSGRTIEDILSGVTNAGGLSAAVFTNKEAVRRVLQELKERDFGQSIVVSGLIEEVFAICREIGLQPHSIILSLGIWGKKELLPRPEVLDIVMMCGHGLISPRLVESLARKVGRGKMTAEEAARELARPCICGAFNIPAAAELIANLAPKLIAEEQEK